MKRQVRLKKHSLPFLLVILILAVAGAGVLAQSGGGYDLSWNTVDGGGGTSTGGSYELSGTVGQADASAPMTGGDYSLTGGFWAGAPCTAPPAAAAQSGADVLFTWSDGATYDIYRAIDAPYFSSGTQIGTGQSSPWSYTEPLLQDPAANAFYTVGSPTACGHRLGEFDFALVPGS